VGRLFGLVGFVLVLYLPVTILLITFTAFLYLPTSCLPFVPLSLLPAFMPCISLYTCCTHLYTFYYLRPLCLHTLYLHLNTLYAFRYDRRWMRAGFVEPAARDSTLGYYEHYGFGWAVFFYCGWFSAFTVPHTLSPAAPHITHLYGRGCSGAVTLFPIVVYFTVLRIGLPVNATYYSLPCCGQFVHAILFSHNLFHQRFLPQPATRW
jgi:hypothetical protein